MTSDELRTLLDDLADGWHARDYVRVASRFALEVSYGDPLRYRLDGREPLLAFFQDDEGRAQHVTWHAVSFDERAQTLAPPTAPFAPPSAAPDRKAKLLALAPRLDELVASVLHEGRRQGTGDVPPEVRRAAGRAHGPHRSEDVAARRRVQRATAEVRRGVRGVTTSFSSAPTPLPPRSRSASFATLPAPHRPIDEMRG